MTSPGTRRSPADVSDALGIRGPERGVASIAVLRANGIGDYVFGLPALGALRQAYPEARITLLGRPWHEAFLAQRPGPLDEVRCLPVAPEEPETPEATRFWAGERDRRYDLAVQLHGGGRHSNPLIARLEAGLTVGARALDAPPLDRWVRYRTRHHEVLRWLEVVALAGASPSATPPILAVTALDRAAAERVVGPGAPALVALCPGAGDPQRRWPPESFGAVAAALAARVGAQVVVTGSAADAELAARVVGASSGAARDLTGLLDLAGLVGLLSRCALVVGNDTGPLHLARAVGAATVGVYWGVNVVHAAPLRSDRHALAIAWDPHCPACGADLADLDRPGCGHDASLVATVSVAEVVDLAVELLA